MSKTTAVVVITSHFPYGIGEDFVAAELPALARRFDRVLIAPLGATTTPVRELPAGVEVLDWQQGGRKLSPSSLARAGRAGIDALHLEMPRSAKIAALSSAWVASASFQARRLQAAVETVLPSDAAVVFYGYWLARHAVIATLLRRSWAGPAVAVARAHGGDVFEERAARGFLPGRRYLARHLDHVYSISEAGRAALENSGFSSARTSVARLGVEATTWRSPECLTQPWVLASCSNAAPVKRLDFLASVVQRLRAAGAPVEWVHIGDTQAGKFDLRDEVARRDLSEVVTLVGRVPNKRVREELARRRAQVFVNVSSSEGVPVTFMEALSMGLPVLATDVGGSSEIVLDSQVGALVSAQANEDEVATRLRGLFEQSQQAYSAMRLRCVQQWEKLSDAQTNYLSFASDLQGLLHTRAGR